MGDSIRRGYGRSCGGRRRYDPDALSRDLILAGGSTIWSELSRQLPCPTCGSAYVRCPPAPFAKAASPDQRLISLAMKVLDGAAYATSREAVADRPEVRLALRVLLPYVPDRAGLLAYWQMAQEKGPNPWTSCREPYFLIAKTLRDAGWHAPV